jgi:putative tricarboxylic transport membrane protein
MMADNRGAHALRRNRDRRGSGALSIYLMWKSTELPIGYISGRGPGGGAWPFWLSAIMLVCCGIIAFNWWRRTSPPSRSEEPFLDSYGWRMVALVGGGVSSSSP